MFDKILNQIIKINAIESNDFKILSENLDIINPKNNYYDEINDSKLLNNLLNIFLKRKNLSGIEKRIIGCDGSTTKNSMNLFSRNNYSNCIYIKKSIECATVWKNVDLSKQAIGSIKDISHLMYLLISKEKDIDLIKEGCEIFNVFVPFIDEKDLWKESPPNIKSLPHVYKKICKNMFYDIESSKIIPSHSKINNIKDLHKYLKKIRLSDDNEKNKKLWEKYSIFFYGLIKVTIFTIKEIFNYAMEFSNIDYKVKLENNVDENLKNLEKLLIFNLGKYIRIKKSKIKNGNGFIENQDDSLKHPKSQHKKKLIRINGGYESITTLINFKDNKLLISLVDSDILYNKDNTIDRLSNFIYGNFNVKSISNNENNNKSIKVNTNNIINRINTEESNPIYRWFYTERYYC